MASALLLHPSRNEATSRESFVSTMSCHHQVRCHGLRPVAISSEHDLHDSHDELFRREDREQER
jgi:hypothetical protein